jgi:hypothetical protein
VEVLEAVDSVVVAVLEDLVAVVLETVVVEILEHLVAVEVDWEAVGDSASNTSTSKQTTTTT